MNQWVISDNHFRHARIWGFTDFQGKRIRPEFDNPRDGDAYMIEMWNQTVKPEDHLWHGGDFCMGNDQHWLDIGPRLNGHKRLIPGNHDKLQHAYNFRAAGFEKVCGAKEIQVAGLRLLFTHYPVHDSCLFKRDGNVHGHTHQNEPPSLRHFNVSVERLGYKPMHIEDLAKIVKERLELYRETHP